jgi:hypothetical protein
VGRARTLAQVYRRFGEVDAAGTSPLYERVAVALSESGEALRAIEVAPAITATGTSRFRSCISWRSVITTFAANVGR